MRRGISISKKESGSAITDGAAFFLYFLLRLLVDDKHLGEDKALTSKDEATGLQLVEHHVIDVENHVAAIQVVPYRIVGSRQVVPLSLVLTERELGLDASLCRTRQQAVIDHDGIVGGELLELLCRNAQVGAEIIRELQLTMEQLTRT